MGEWWQGVASGGRTSLPPLLLYVVLHMHATHAVPIFLAWSSAVHAFFLCCAVCAVLCERARGGSPTSPPHLTPHPPCHSLHRRLTSCRPQQMPSSSRGGWGVGVGTQRVQWCGHTNTYTCCTTLTGACVVSGGRVKAEGGVACASGGRPLRCHAPAVKDMCFVECLGPGLGCH